MFGKSIGTVSVPLPDFKNIVKGQIFSLGDIHKRKKMGVTSKGKDLTINRSSDVVSFLF